MSVSKAARDKLPTPKADAGGNGPAAAPTNGHAAGVRLPPREGHGVRSGVPANPPGEWIETWTDADEARANGLFQILDEKGRADRARVPKLAPEELRRM